jgi:hypothetical protein
VAIDKPPDRVRAGRLDRFRLYANVAARLAEVVANDDRVGLIVFSDRTLAVCSPDRSMPAVRACGTRWALTVQSRSRARCRAVRIVQCSSIEHSSSFYRSAMPQRLVLARAVPCCRRISSWWPRRNTEIGVAPNREARGWRDPWIALAAQEHESRANAQRLLLRRLGAPVVATREDLLEQAVFDEYESLRRSRRI